VSTPVLDLVFTYQFLRRLATPFEQWEAFRLGIIDKDGNVLRKRKTLTTPEEVSAWGYFDRMVANLKKLIGKVPGGKSKIASYAAALLLLKEQNKLKDLEEHQLEKETEILLSRYLNEEIANVVGNGNIASVGVGPQGEPPASKKNLIIKKMTKRKLNV
jgi:hypothetical protein